MLELLAKVFVYAFEAYALVGLVFAALFVSVAVHKLDSEARASGFAFRLLIVPGVAAFWPTLLARWIRGLQEPPLERNPHRI
jgi:hypothetical protein